MRSAGGIHYTNRVATTLIEIIYHIAPTTRTKQNTGEKST